MEKTKINGDFIDKETNERENRDTESQRGKIN